MELAVGSRMIAEFSTKERMNCQFVGASPNEFVVLKVPMVPGIRERFAEGVFIQFRYLNDGKIIGFGADILKYQASPASLVFLSYPTEFSEYNLRNEGRVECLFPTTIAVSGTTCQGNIVDINTNGCRFVFQGGVAPKMEENASVSGSFATMEGDKKYEFKGVVAASKLKGDDKWLGIKFEGEVQLPEGVQAYLKKFEEMRDIEAVSKAD